MKSVILSSPFRCGNKSFRSQRINKQTEEEREKKMRNKKVELSNFPPRTGWLEMEDEDDFHVYEDIDVPPSTTKKVSKLEKKKNNFEIPTKLLTTFHRSCSDSELFHVSTLHERHEIELSANVVCDDVTFGYCQPEQGFYRCHDNIEDIQEKDIIPDLAPKLLREKRHLLREMSKELDVVYDEKTTKYRRRLSLDSGRGGSVVAEEEDLVIEAAGLEDAAISSTFLPTRCPSSTSFPSRTSSMSSGIGSMQSSCSTLMREKSLNKIESSKKEFCGRNEEEEIVSFASKTCRPTSCGNKNEKTISSKQLSCENEAKDFFLARKLPAQPKRDLDEFVEGAKRENGCAQKSPPPPPLPPRNALPRKVASRGNNSISNRLPHQEFSRIRQKRLPGVQRTASKEVAQSVEALQQISEDLLSLMNGQNILSSRPFSPVLKTASLYTPRPRLPSPPPPSELEFPSTITRFRQTASPNFDDESDDLLVRSATLPCKRTLNFMDSSMLMLEEKQMSSENNNNNNNITINYLATPAAVAPLLFVDDDVTSVRRSASTRNRRQSSIRFRNPLQQRRKSDVSSRRTKKPETVTPSPVQTSKGTKRRRTLFNLASPFSAKNKSTKVRRTSESKQACFEEVEEPEEERFPIALDEMDKQDVEDAIREGLPVIPFFQTPKTGFRSQPRRSELQNQLILDSMTVRALATPLSSRRLPSTRLEDHLILLPPRSKDFLLDGGYFNMKSSCSGRHCQSCTCKNSPKLLFTEDNADYVQMEARTPNL